MSQKNRLATGGRIDRTQTCAFSFNNRRYEGHPGDTLASALLANAVSVVGRSFKYHRPRGIVAAGVEEPNALVQLATGARTQPNVPATVIELRDGLRADSVNCWPSVDFDAGAITGLFAPIMPAGFYYKTFMWPARYWMAYEHVIRRAAGLGKAPAQPDPDIYDKMNAHCDVLVVGAGPAGLAAALAAGRAGARVILADQQPEPGGQLLAERARIDGAPALDWAGAAMAEIAAMDEVRVLSRTTAFGYYDHNYLALVERRQTDASDAARGSRERLWKVRAKQVVLATGAIERPLVFAHNDRPGVMLAGAVRHYVNRYGVAPGRNVVVFTNNDDAYRTALDLADAGDRRRRRGRRAPRSGRRAGPGNRRARDRGDQGVRRRPGRRRPAPSRRRRHDPGRIRPGGDRIGAADPVRRGRGLRRLEPGDPSVLAIRRQGPVRRRQRLFRPRPVGAGGALRRRVQRRLRSRRLPRGGLRCRCGGRRRRRFHPQIPAQEAASGERRRGAIEAAVGEPRHGR